MMTEYAMHAMTVPIEVSERPLPGHLAPLDKRHRWMHRSTTKAGDFWYRCRVCHKRKLVRAITNMIAKKMRDAEHYMEERLSETLWTAP